MAIVTKGAISYVTYRNLQIQTAREIEATEQRIAALLQDDIPSLQAEIDRQLGRYDLREKLQLHGSKLSATPPNRIELLPDESPIISQQTHRH